jgi:hypothetical protein
VNPETGFGRLYKKTYMHGLNILPGNCVVGGLLPIGRRQHLKNGEFLRAAYIGEGPLKIFPHANLSVRYLKYIAYFLFFFLTKLVYIQDLPYDRIYLRSDDQERTIGSGQALVDGIFPPDGTMSESTSRMLNWFVADMATDHVNTNEAICPMMGYVCHKVNQLLCPNALKDVSSVIGWW